MRWDADKGQLGVNEAPWHRVSLQDRLGVDHVRESAVETGHRGRVASLANSTFLLAEARPFRLNPGQNQAERCLKHHFDQGAWDANAQRSS